MEHNSIEGEVAEQHTMAEGEMAGHDLGFINPALYRIANNSAKYAADFYDVIQGTNKGGELPGYDASKGWDAVTGLGTPNAANLLPDLITEAND